MEESSVRAIFIAKTCIAAPVGVERYQALRVVAGYPNSEL